MLNVNSRFLAVVSLLFGLIGGILGAFLFTGSLVIAQPTSAETAKAIAAQEFRLVDAKGQTRALLAFSDKGQPYLQFTDEFGTDRVWVGISSETGLVARDVDGKTRLVLSVDEEGLPSLVVRDREHHTKEFHP